MIESPIQLTPEQKQAYTQEKQEEFWKGFKELKEKTGMTMVPVIKAMNVGNFMNGFIAGFEITAVVKSEQKVDNQSI